MANASTRRVYVIDTASGTAIHSLPIIVGKIRWVGGTTAAHLAEVQDASGNVYWASACPAADYVEESDFTTLNSDRGMRMAGIKVPTLDSGKLYIYLAG